MDGENSPQKTTSKRELQEEGNVFSVELSAMKSTKRHKKKKKHRHKENNHKSREPVNISVESPETKENKNHKHLEEIKLKEELSPFEHSTDTDYIPKKKKKKKHRHSKIAQENGETSNVSLESHEEKKKKTRKRKHFEENRTQEVLSLLEHSTVINNPPKKKIKDKHRQSKITQENEETNNVILESPKKSKKNKNHKHLEENQLKEGLSPFEYSTDTDYIPKKKKKKKHRHSEIAQENGETSNVSLESHEEKKEKTHKRKHFEENRTQEALSPLEHSMGIDNPPKKKIKDKHRQSKITQENEETNNVLLESPEKIKKKKSKLKHFEEIKITEELSPLECSRVADYTPKKKKKCDKREKSEVGEISVLDKASRLQKCVNNTLMKTVSEKHSSFSEQSQKKKKHEKKSAGVKTFSGDETEGVKFNASLKKKRTNQGIEGDSNQATRTINEDISLCSIGSENDDQHEKTTGGKEKNDESEVDVRLKETQIIPKCEEDNGAIRQCLLENNSITYTGNVKKSLGNFTYWIQENDNSAEENATRKKKSGMYNLVDIQTRSVYFDSWDTQCITIPKEISALVHSNTPHRTKEDQERLLERGIKFRTGVFMEVEDNILKENFNNYVTHFPIDEPMKLLYTSHTDDPHYYRKICRETNFYIHLVGNLNRHVASCYDRARKIIPRIKTGVFSKEESETLQMLYEIHGSQWAKIGLEMGRDSQQVSCHWKFLNKQSGCIDVRKGWWTKEEEENLVASLKEVLGTNELSKIKHYYLPWRKIAKKVGTRNGQQCVTHWTLAMRGKKRFEPVDQRCIKKFNTWRRSDGRRLAALINSLEIEFEDEINWENLLLHFPHVGSPQFLHECWTNMRIHFCYKRELPFAVQKKLVYQYQLKRRHFPKRKEWKKFVNHSENERNGDDCCEDGDDS